MGEAAQRKSRIYTIPVYFSQELMFIFGKAGAAVHGPDRKVQEEGAEDTEDHPFF